MTYQLWGTSKVQYTLNHTQRSEEAGHFLIVGGFYSATSLSRYSAGAGARGGRRDNAPRELLRCDPYSQATHAHMCELQCTHSLHISRKSNACGPLQSKSVPYFHLRFVDISLLANPRCEQTLGDALHYFSLTNILLLLLFLLLLLPPRPPLARNISAAHPDLF